MRLAMVRVLLVALALALGACASSSPTPEIVSRTAQGGKGVPNGKSEGPGPFLPLSRLAQDRNYGFSPDNPIKVGGEPRTGWGPCASESISILCAARMESRSNTSAKGHADRSIRPMPSWAGGLLDAFKIVYPGLREELTLYINMYDEAPLQVPVGFTPRRPEPVRPDPKRKLPVVELGYAERA